MIGINNIDGSEEIELNGLRSLQYLNMSLQSLERLSMRNLPSLKHLVLETNKLNKTMTIQLFKQFPYIKHLELNSGVFSDINLDDFANLEKLSISGSIAKNFNFGLFNSLCKHLRELSISIKNIDDENMIELLFDYYFPTLVKLDIKYGRFRKLEKKYFKEFPKLKSLNITNKYIYRFC